MAAKRSQEMRVFLAAILRSKSPRAVRAALCEVCEAAESGCGPRSAGQAAGVRRGGQLTFLTWMRGLAELPSSWFHLEGETE